VIFEELPVAGAFVVRLEARSDERGFFARTWCEDEFQSAGIDVSFVQQSIARTTTRGTLRGMHIQLPPHSEAKYVRCVAGSIFDAILDLRPESKTYLQSASVVVDALAGDAVYVPAGCAHGYLTLSDHTDVLYAMSARYAPQAARSILWSDPALGISWPSTVPMLSPADRQAPTLEVFLAAQYRSANALK
jgi:dTDP-4-dehydrorhamnose 3,5-epimerase